MARKASKIRVNLRIPLDELKGSILVTGFRGYGLVGYLVSRYIATALKAERVGYIITNTMPPGIVVEDGGVGFPFDIYYSKDHNILVVVNRALPERREWDAYAEFLAEMAANIEAKLAILVGGLSREFKPEDEKYGYRWIANSYYNGKRLEAPRMEEGLGIMGPLALLYIYMDYYKVPTIVVLPYSAVEEADYRATLRGVEVVSELVGVKVDLTILEKAVEAQKLVAERVAEMVKAVEERREGEKSFYM